MIQTQLQQAVKVVSLEDLEWSKYKSPLWEGAFQEVSISTSKLRETLTDYGISEFIKGMKAILLWAVSLQKA